MMVSSFDISDRLAIVTGSSRGIGLGLAIGLAEAGARVILHGRDEAALARAADAMTAATGREPAMTIAFDIRDRAAVDAGFDGIEAALGPVDILVNNAGIQRRGEFVDIPLSDWDDVIATNLTSAFLVGQRVARGMVERGRGKIVNIGSLQSRLGRANIVPYSAAKGGIAMLTRAMCAALAADGIQVNALAPGYFATDLTRALVEDEQFDGWLRARTPAARWGRIEDLVGTLIYLVSPASDFVNGQIVYVDGGMSAVV
jgi:gluconate 5-dehydrogenase